MTMRKMKWLDRTLLVSPYYFCLCTSQADFVSVLRHIGIKHDDWPEFSKSDEHATVHFLPCENTNKCAIVCLKHNHSKTGVQICGLLVHEAMHIWRRIREELGEHEPSAEMEAYAMQWISQELMQAYLGSLYPRVTKK